MDDHNPIRINKYLADRGFSTRRGADELITAGKVLVNGAPAELGQKVTDKDTVEVRGATKQRYRYFRYYKPRGIITHSPAEGETDIVTALKTEHGITGVFPIGRLDKDSKGLMLLTDDGRVTERLLNPKKAHEREYEVAVDKKVTNAFLKKLARGVNIEGYVTRHAKATPLHEKTFLLTLTEGKKHQVRRMCAALGYQVKSLRRIRIDTLELGTLKPNEVKELKGLELKKFLTGLGLNNTD